MTINKVRGSAGMICETCGSRNDPDSGRCLACAVPLFTLAGDAPSARPPNDNSYAAHLAALLAAAQTRLALLTEHISAVKAEAVAIAESLAAARRASAEAADLHASARLSGLLHAALDAGTFRLTFADPRGARIEPIVPLRVGACTPRIMAKVADIPSVDVRADAANAIWEAFSDGARAVRVTGEHGAGATTLLAVLSRQARSRGFADGALCVNDVRGPATDIGQRLAALVEADLPPRYYLAAELRELFTHVRALILLDGARISGDEQADLTETFPDLRFVIVDSLVVPGTPAVRLGPIDSDAALMLVETGYGRTVEGDERNAAAALAATVGALPGRLRLVGIAARGLRRSFGSLHAEFATGNEIVAAYIAKLPAGERSILGILTMAPALLTCERLGRVAGGEVRSSLERLVDCGLVYRIDGRFTLPSYVEPLVPQPAAANAVFDRLIEVLRADFDPRSAPPALDRELAAAETLVQISLKRSYWLKVLALGPGVAQQLALRGAFGAWGRVLNLIMSAAKRVDDATTVNAARHDLGVRCLLLGEYPKAAAFLQAAAQDCERIGDQAGAAASADVLARLSDLVPLADPRVEQRSVRERRLPLEPNVSLDRVAAGRLPPGQPPPLVRPSLPEDDASAAPPSRPQAPSPEAPLQAPALLLPQRRSARSTAPTSVKRAASFADRCAPLAKPLFLTGLALAAVAILGVVFWPRLRPDAAPAIAQFSTDHRSISVGSTAQLCLKAKGATLVAIVPGIGTLPAEGTHCITVAPALTTTYTAVATSSAGQEERTVTVAVQNSPQRRLQIQQFSALPARVSAGESTRLCYAVTGAAELRIVPHVGNLLRLHSCRTVTLSEPHRYTYSLLAFGENGQVAVRRARIDVVAVATPAPVPSLRPMPRRVALPTLASAPLEHQRRKEPDGQLARRAVYQFDATPAVVERGQTASLCVGVGRWAQGSVTAIGTLQPGITRCYRVHPTATTVYRLHVALNKSVAYETVTVAVRPRSRDGMQSQHR